MILIELVEARRNLLLKCEDLFTDIKIAEQIYRYLCEGLEECDFREVKTDEVNNNLIKMPPADGSTRPKELCKTSTGNIQISINENRSVCKLRHKNGNCLCVGGFCTAINDEICKSIRMAYEKGYVDGKTDVVRHGRWVNLKISAFDNSSAECSLCGAVVYESFTNSKAIHYCPNCGAKMMREDEEMSKVSEMEMAYAEYLND